MFTYFINNIFIFLLMYFNRKIYLFLWILLSVSVILYFLPSTGDDYIYYKGDYDSSYLDSIFPYFYSNYSLDAEPFYKFYTSFVKVTTGLSFNGFLVLNFIFCSFLLFNIFKDLFSTKYIVVFFVFSLSFTSSIISSTVGIHYNSLIASIGTFIMIIIASISIIKFDITILVYMIILHSLCILIYSSYILNKKLGYSYV